MSSAHVALSLFGDCLRLLETAGDCWRLVKTMQAEQRRGLLPNFYGLVATCADQSLTIGIKRDRLNPVGVIL